jgi:threonine dehydratase
MTTAPPTIEDVREAARRIAPHVHRTPVMTSSTLDSELDARVFFKCENFQKVGAFKARGAVNAVLSLDERAASRGVITHSSGNHAQALAYAAGLRRIPCTIVMPEEAPRIKVEAVRGYGAQIVFCPRSERESVCNRLHEEQGSVLIHPFAYPPIIAGQGTVALELLEQVDQLDLVIAPVGGDTVDDAYRSLTTGVLQPAVPDPQTLGDGLMTGLGQINFEILRERGVRIVTVTEESMVHAGRFILERMKLVVEPSAATVLAAIRRIAQQLRGRRVGAIPPDPLLIRPPRRGGRIPTRPGAPNRGSRWSAECGQKNRRSEMSAPLGNRIDGSAVNPHDPDPFSRAESRRGPDWQAAVGRRGE